MALPLTSRHRTRHRRVLRDLGALTCLVVLTTALAAPPGGAGGGGPRAEDGGAPEYAGPGRYAAGVTTLQLADRPVEVWYPAKRTAVRGREPDTYDLLTKVPPEIATLLPADTDVTFRTDAYRDVRAARKRRGFPLVVLTHGVAGYREQLSYLASHLATWGFVVASPEVLERNLASFLGARPRDGASDDLALLRDTVTLVRGESDRRGSPLRGRVRPDVLAVAGQSAGGSAAIRSGGEPGVVAVVALSASGFDGTSGTFLPFPEVPLMLVTGASDQIVPLANVERGFETAPPPVRLVAIEAAGHANLTDICPIGGAGGLVGVAEAAQLPVPENLKRLAADGCASPAPDPDPAWPVVRHAVTAHLREAFGTDDRAVGLDPVTMGWFRPVTVEYRERR